MPIRIFLISLLVLRGLLGPACGRAPVQAAESSGCCRCESGEACCETDLPLACMLCAACEGRVPSLPPVTGAWDPGFHAIFDEWDHSQPGLAEQSIAAPKIVASQVVAKAPWRERLRPTICVWTI